MAACTALIGVLMLAGCASSPRIYSNASPTADPSSYSTFGFSQRLGTDRSAGQRSILSTYLVNATRREMEALGYRYADSGADLEVNFYLHTREKVQASSTPSVGVGYYGYRGGLYSAWGGYDTTVDQYTEGTLNVDLVDTGRRELVWEGVAVGRLSDRVRENLEPAVNDVIGAIFSRHPLAPAE